MNLTDMSMPFVEPHEHLFGPYDAVCSKCGMTREQAEEVDCERT